jgi:hypothetical protein
MKNKTFAVWLTFLLGPVGLHRVYLQGRFDWLSRALLVLTSLGLYGVHRAREISLDDELSWLLIPLLGFALAGCALTAIVYGLTDVEKWNQKFNPTLDVDAIAGQTNWLTVGGLVTALLLGTTVLMASIAFSFQRYFEYQIEEAKSISQPENMKKSED